MEVQVPSGLGGPDGVRFCVASALWATGAVLEGNMEVFAGEGRWLVRVEASWPGRVPSGDEVSEDAVARLACWAEGRSRACLAAGDAA